jgi:predicted metal-dependent phosphoesterase TrpH
VIDLHTHTTASDGRLSPEQLIGLARDIGLSGVAITDHDTADGIAPARDAARRIGMPFIPGIEISAEYTATGTMHILGYFIDETDESFRQAVVFLQEARGERNPKIIECLNSRGIPVSMEDVRQQAGSDHIGRPHFARAIVRKGYASSVGEAFERYIKKGAPCYVNKSRFSPRRSIELIRNASGIPVLAHPDSLNIDPLEELPKLLGELVGMGLLGIECYYYNHSKEKQAYYLKLAERLSIIATGGSDFHGDDRPKVALGTGTGGLRVPDEVMERLAAEKERITGERLP